jgi:hypothetical protein
VVLVFHNGMVNVLLQVPTVRYGKEVCLVTILLDWIVYSNFGLVREQRQGGDSIKDYRSSILASGTVLVVRSIPTTLRYAAAGYSWRLLVVSALPVAFARRLISLFHSVVERQPDIR